MKRISINTNSKYDFIIGASILEDIGTYALDVFSPCKICIVTDGNVNLIYGKIVYDSLLKKGFEPYVFSFNPGETSKSLVTYEECLEFLAEKNFTRTDGIISLGGGISGDLAGFIAATFLRGIKYIQIPTTFLAALDSSVGGKTGVNLSKGKNLAGAFWQPSLVLCDTNTFKTLSDEIFLDGVAEAIKYGIILDKNLFEKIYTNAPITASYDLLEDIISSCIKIKADLVMKDERDTGARQLLNLGHTIGHAIEKCSNYSISHGHAVATGIAIIAKASHDFGYTDLPSLSLIIDVLQKHGFVTKSSFSVEELSPFILSDKKRGGSSINLILPSKIGFSEIIEFPVKSLNGFLKAGMK
jgi:3-dehydroquinate synthase